MLGFHRGHDHDQALSHMLLQLGRHRHLAASQQLGESGALCSSGPDSKSICAHKGHSHTNFKQRFMEPLPAHTQQAATQHSLLQTTPAWARVHTPSAAHVRTCQRAIGALSIHAARCLLHCSQDRARRRGVLTHERRAGRAQTRQAQTAQPYPALCMRVAMGKGRRCTIRATAQCRTGARAVRLTAQTPYRVRVWGVLRSACPGRPSCARPARRGTRTRPGCR